MNSRELVIDTLEFNNPARVPRQLWVVPLTEMIYKKELTEIKNKFPDDIVLAPPAYKTSLKRVGDPYIKGDYIDEWNCKFINLQNGIRGQVKEPLIKGADDIKKIRIPEERLNLDTSVINSYCKKANKFVLPPNTSTQRPFERLQFLRTTENLFMDLVDQPDYLYDLIDIVHDFYKKEIEVWCKTDVDGIWICDDWGAQNSLLVDPMIWRKLFKPLYKDYVQIAHQYGKYVFFHSDGNIFSILDDIVELQIDALNAQLSCMNIREIGRKYKGRITFWGEIDRQHILPYGEPSEVAAAVKEIYECLYSSGGVIAQCEFGPGAKPKNILTVFQSWNEIV